MDQQDMIIFRKLMDNRKHHFSQITKKMKNPSDIIDYLNVELKLSIEDKINSIKYK